MVAFFMGLGQHQSGSGCSSETDTFVSIRAFHKIEIIVGEIGANLNERGTDQSY
ncbi:MAG: hypothetical protein U5K35_06680 [Rhodohalobacter sp.]|nr:hypothetical protein [Rhodohalobacter sp.]